LLYLESVDPDREISMYINSPGGSITAGLAIYDTMQFIRPDVVTICMGQASSMAALLLAAGAKGKRLSLPNSKILIHQPSLEGLRGQATHVRIYAEEIFRIRTVLSQILADCTGKPLSTVDRDVERDFILSPSQAVEYGLIDSVITTRDRDIVTELATVGV
jgi:ATP-dependent Clp protease protease subunit